MTGFSPVAACSKPMGASEIGPLGSLPEINRRGEVSVMRTICVVAVFCVVSCGLARAGTAPSSIAASVSDSGRPGEDTARDAGRKPAEVVTFAGVKPGMVVAELLPGTGYYTRILARAVGSKGKVYAIVPTAVVAAFPSALERIKELAAAYPNVWVIVCDLNELALPEKVDLVWTTENYHDFHIAPLADIPSFNRSVFNSLKRGGVFLVEDHRAEEGAEPGVTSRLHRMDEAVAKHELEAAGFRIDAESDILWNPADSRQGPSGDSSIHDRTDRFLFRLKRP
jgi:predicted methyltransferase